MPSVYSDEYLSKTEVIEKTFKCPDRDAEWREFCHRLKKEGYTVHTDSYGEFRTVMATRAKA